MRERADAFAAIAAAIRENLEALATLESHNIGKPICDARDEIELGIPHLRVLCRCHRQRARGQTLPVAKGGLDLTLREPMGVVAGIVPWNFLSPLRVGKWHLPRCRKHCRAQARIDFSSHGSGAGPACP